MKKRIFYIIILLVLFFVFWRYYVEGQFVDYDCINFKTQEDAQKMFNKYSYDKYFLDANHNGIACESLPKGGNR